MSKRILLLMLVVLGLALPLGNLLAQNGPADSFVKKRFMKNVPGVGKEDTRMQQIEEKPTQNQNQKPAAAQKPNVPKAEWHPANLTRHWEKHQKEFPNFKTEKEYGDFAINFFQNPPQGTLFKRNQAGDYLFYYQKWNLFGVATKDGVPKTMFRPSQGINYWNRQ